MKLRGLVVAAAVLAALIGVLYWSNHDKPEEDSSVKAALKSSPKILSLNQADIVQVAIERNGQSPVDLVKNDAGTWHITEPEALGADQGAVSSLLSSLGTLDSERLVEEKVSDLTPYGLATPQLVLNVTLKNKTSEKLLIGDKTPTGSSYYAKLSEDPRLFTLASYNESSLNKTANDLRDKRLFTADFDKVSQIELDNLQPGKKNQITFGRNKNEWQILKPQPYRTDNFQVEELVRSLKDARIELDSSSDEKKDAAAFQSAPPFAMANIVDAAGTQEIQVRKVKNDYYAKSSVLSGVYKVPASVGTALDKSLDDFRNKKLFDFGYSDPDKIEIHDGNKSYYLTRSGSDWWGPDGKKWDQTTVDSLLDKLRDLSASKFPSSGFTTAAVRISVLSNDKKREESVQLAKSKDAYIAKRDAEPALYEIPSSSVTDLEKAAADLKPAAPKAPAAKSK